MRWKYDSEDSRAFKCCFCCHVRVGTVILGLWHLIVHVFVIGCLIMSSLHPELLRDGMEPGTSMESDGILVVDNKSASGDSFGDFQIKYETPSVYRSPFEKKMRKEDMCLAFALILCTFLIALMLVYGAIKSRPGYLIPFFCLQVFDFCLNCLTVVGYMSYAPNVKLWIVEQGLERYPMMERLINMDEDRLMMLFVILFVLILSIKAYLIDMVWSCYKYLNLRNANRSVVREYTLDPDSEMLLPPKYEEAIKMKQNEPSPPPYTA